MIGGVYNCVTISTLHPSVGNLGNPPWGIWCQGCDAVTCHTVTVTVVKKINELKVDVWFWLWLCNKSTFFGQIYQ